MFYQIEGVFVYIWAFSGGSEVKASACNEGDLGLIPGLERSPGEGNGNPLQYSFLENPMDRGAWWATVHGIAKSQTPLSDFTLLSDTAAAAVAATKLLQQYLTLCDSIDSSQPGSSVPGILQTRILECVAISFPSGKNKIPQIYNFAENMENLLSYFKGIECQVYVKN